MRIAVYGSRRQAPYADTIQMLLRKLVLDGADITMHPKLYDHLGKDLQMNLSGVACGNASAIPENTGLVLSIGGDGTFLRTAAWTGTSEVPILGINTGNLGYLSALSMQQALEVTDDIVAGNFAVEPRTLLQVVSPEVRGWPFALNEVVVAKDESASMVTVDASLSGKHLADYKADGLIVSTPTGSTAYNLSAGGPIVEPTAPVWILSPIAAHSLGMRPLVVSNANDIRLVVDGRSRHFRLAIDGRSTVLDIGSEVVLRKAEFHTVIVQSHGNEFPAPLGSKLFFN